MGRGITPGEGSPWWVKDTALPILCSVSALLCHQKFVTLPSTATDQSDIFTELVCISSCIFAFLSPPPEFSLVSEVLHGHKVHQFNLHCLSLDLRLPPHLSTLGVPNIHGTHWSEGKAETWQNSSCAFQDFFIFLTNSLK